MARANAEDLMSRSALAKLAGISPTTLRNWTKLNDEPLEVVERADGSHLYSWSFLLRFCDNHPDLQGVAAVRDQQRQVAAREDADTPGSTNLRVALTEMKRALDSNLAAIARATKVATETAASHAETVAALQQTIRAYELAATVNRSA